MFYQFKLNVCIYSVIHAFNKNTYAFIRPTIHLIKMLDIIFRKNNDPDLN